jgi:hypothetical protein
MFDLRTLAKISVPAVLGLGFIGIVWMNHGLFRGGIITVRGAIGIEVLYLLVFLGSVLWTFISALWNIRNRHIVWSLLAICSIVLGFFFTTVGIENGAAVVYAT